MLQAVVRTKTLAEMNLATQTVVPEPVTLAAPENLLEIIYPKAQS